VEQNTNSVKRGEQMKYALNIQKGSTINHPLVGKIEGGVATPVTDKEAEMIKHIINVVVFDSIKERELPE